MIAESLIIKAASPLIGAQGLHQHDIDKDCQMTHPIFHSLHPLAVTILSAR